MNLTSTGLGTLTLHPRPTGSTAAWDHFESKWHNHQLAYRILLFLVPFLLPLSVQGQDPMRPYVLNTPERVSGSPLNANLVGFDIPEIRLSKPSQSRSAISSRKNPLVGVNLAVDPTLTLDGSWHHNTDGSRTWLLAVRVPGSAGLRLHLKTTAKPGGILGVSSGQSESQIEIVPPRVFTASDTDVWTPIVFSERLLLAYTVGPDSSEQDAPFRLVEVGHFGEDFRTKRAEAAQPQAIGGCYVDASCYTQWTNSAESTVYLVIPTPQGQETCSGTLMATRNHSNIPYLLTASHCITNQTEALYTEFFWNYKTPYCNGPIPTAGPAPVFGSDLLVWLPPPQSGDFGFVRLDGLPQGAAISFSAWDPATVSLNAQQTGIGYPGYYDQGALPATISFGFRAPDGDFVDPAMYPSAYYYNVRMTLGVQYHGSSGGPFFSSPGVLSAVVSHGPTVNDICSVSPLVVGAGRFSIVYPYLVPYLEDSRPTPPAATIVASPNPIQLCDGTSVASVSLKFNAPTARQIRINVNSPNGQFVVQGNASSGSAGTSKTITNGSIIYLSADYGTGFQTVAQTTTISVTNAGCANVPAINAQSGVLNIAGAAGFAPGAFFSVYGKNLAPSAQTWGVNDFVAGQLPTKLNGASLTVGGRFAYIYYVSPTQINAIMPSGQLGTPVGVQVVSGYGSSNTLNIQMASVAPVFFKFYQAGGAYAIAQFSDGSVAGNPGVFGTSIPSRPAKSGDILAFYVTGLGPTNPTYAEGQVIRESAKISSPITFFMNGVQCAVDFAGIVQAGLYQVNVHVPAIPDGDAQVRMTVGTSTSPVALVTVHH